MTSINVQDLPGKYRVTYRGVTYYRGFVPREIEGGMLPNEMGAELIPKLKIQRINFRNFAAGFGNSEMVVGGVGMKCAVEDSPEVKTSMVPALIPVRDVQFVSNSELGIIASGAIVPYKIPRAELKRIFKNKEIVERIVAYGNELQSKWS